MPLAKLDKKTLYRVCDQCNTELTHFKLKKDIADVQQTLSDKLKIYQDELETIDDRTEEERRKLEALKTTWQKMKIKLEDKVHKQTNYRNELST